MHCRSLLALALLLLPAFAKDKKPVDPPSPLTQEQMQMAYNVGVNYISERLKAPSTAKFQPIEGIRFNPDGRVLFTRHRITFEIWVDAQNSFGAMLRNRFYCGVDPNPLPEDDHTHKVLCIEQKR